MRDDILTALVVIAWLLIGIGVMVNVGFGDGLLFMGITAAFLAALRFLWLLNRGRRRP